MLFGLQLCDNLSATLQYQALSDAEAQSIAQMTIKTLHP